MYKGERRVESKVEKERKIVVSWEWCCTVEAVCNRVGE